MKSNAQPAPLRTVPVQRTAVPPYVRKGIYDALNIINEWARHQDQEETASEGKEARA